MEELEISQQPLGRNDGFEAVIELCEKGVREGVFPGATLLVGRRGEVVLKRAFGTKSLRTTKFPEPAAVEVETVFDLAGLTSIVVTTTLIMKLVESGKLRLEDRVSRYIQGFSVLGKSSITVRQVLGHCAGLPAWVPFFEELMEAQSGARRGIVTSRGARDHIYNSINRMELKYEPGTKQIYSDVGMILMGQLVELLTGLSLDKASQRYIFQPLGLKSTSYVDLSMIKRRGIHPVTDLIAPTEECPWRKRVLCGEVHDDNAWVMGGIAGHSGLFSTVPELHVFTNELLRSWRGRSSFVRKDVLDLFWRGPDEFPEGWRYGWDSPGKENGMLEAGLSARAIGQNGFTGCSVWLEPEEGLEIILMTNRVHPSRANKKILTFRPELYGMVIKALKG